jgi:Uma2 family endonuclease
MGVIEALPAELGVARHRFSVEQYESMAGTGLLAPDARVELIEGVVVDMAPIGSRHTGTVKRLIRAITSAVGVRAILQVQDPLRLGDFSEPEPDLALLKPREDFYTGATPTAADALLVIEVSQTSAAYDRDIKLPLYAAHGVPEVWIIDLDAALVRLYRRPEGDRYTEVSATPMPGLTPVRMLDGVSIDLSGVL